MTLLVPHALLRFTCPQTSSVTAAALSPQHSTRALQPTHRAHTRCPPIPMLRLPSAVLVWMADSWLTNADTNALARCCTGMMHAMQRYRWKNLVSLLDAVGRPSAPSASSAASVSVGPRGRFGLVQRVYIPDEFNCPLAQLPDLLRRLPSSVVDVSFDEEWDAPVESLVLPDSVRSIHLGIQFGYPIHAWRLPTSLTELTLSYYFNQPLDGLQLPATLRRLSLGYDFSHSLAALSLPPGLEELRLSAQWNRPLSDLPALPLSLLLLEMGHWFDQPLETLQQPWPPQLRTLVLSNFFNQPLRGVRLPEFITELRLGYEWNHSLAGVRLPHSLTSLTVDGLSFKHSLNGVAWPAGLRSLSLPAEWNQPVAGLRLPPSLTQLNLGYRFCQSLRVWAPPASLTDFALTNEWKGFDAVDLRLPQGLTRFAIPTEWSVELADLTLPAGLQWLRLGEQTRVADPARMRFPAALTELDLSNCGLRSLAGFAWPAGLTHLHTGSFDGSLLDWSPPASLTRLDLGDAWVSWTQPVSQLLLPPQLTELRIAVVKSRAERKAVNPARCEAPLAALILPPSLRCLAVFADWTHHPLSGLALPPLLEAIELELRDELTLEGLQLPDSLRELRLTGRDSLPQSLRSLRLPPSLRVLAVSDRVERALSDLPLSVPRELRVVEVWQCDPDVSAMWREWVASSPQVHQRGCVVVLCDSD